MSPERGVVRALLRWLPAVGWMAVIFVLSSQSGLRVSDDAAIDEPLRLLAHGGVFAVLAGAFVLALAGERRPATRHALVAFALAAAYGITDEIHQILVPDRGFELVDIAADATGAAIGAAAVWWLLRRWR